MERKAVVAALQAAILTGNWDFAGELADEVSFVDCLRCFAAPRLLQYDDETKFYMNLFCADCWYTHVSHALRARCALAECPDCDVIGYITGMTA